MRIRRVFISYASQDASSALRIYDELGLAPGVKPWLDKRDLVGGSDWDLTIRREIEQADAFVLLLSGSSTTKRGYIQKEIRAALEVIESLPEESIFILPLRLEECNVHFRRLSRIQHIDMFPDWDVGIAGLRRALLVHLGVPTGRSIDRSSARPPPVRDHAPGPLRVRGRVLPPALCATRYGRGVLLGAEDGRMTQVAPDGTPAYSRNPLAAPSGLTALSESGTQGLLLGTSAGDVYRLPTWDSAPTPVAQLERQIYGLHEAHDGTVYATAGTREVTHLSPAGTRSATACDDQAFRVVAGAENGGAVVAVAGPNDAGLLHLYPGSDPRFEPVPGHVNARGLARSPLTPIYALGSAIQGLSLFDYEAVPPGDGARASGWALTTKSVLIYEDRAGEAFDPYQNATPCVAVAFSSDGRRVAGGHADGQVAVWDTTTGRELGNAQMHAAVSDVVFLRGDVLLVATNSGTHLCEIPGATTTSEGARP